MSDFTIYQGDSAEDILTVIPQIETERLFDFQIYHCADYKNPSDKIECIFSVSRNDAILLRDFLTSIINLPVPGK